MSIWIGKIEKFMGEQAPWFLRNRWKGTFLQAVALQYDIAIDTLAQGLRLSQPLRCDVSALPHLARDRSIALYPTEPIPSQRFRLSQWWQLHRGRGSHQGEMRHAQPYFLPGTLPRIRIVHQSGGGSPVATWHTLDPSGRYSAAQASPSNFNIDGTASKWSRWAAFVDMSGTAYTGPATYGDGDTYGDGLLYGSAGSTPFYGQRQADVAAMLYDWKAAHSWCEWIIAWWPMTGGAPFPDASSTPTQDASGWWSLPNGANTWTVLADPVTGLATRPPNMLWLRDTPG